MVCGTLKVKQLEKFWWENVLYKKIIRKFNSELHIRMMEKSFFFWFLFHSGGSSTFEQYKKND